jgi:hypothetical protein
MRMKGNGDTEGSMAASIFRDNSVLGGVRGEVYWYWIAIYYRSYIYGGRVATGNHVSWHRLKMVEGSSQGLGGIAKVK